MPSPAEVEALTPLGSSVAGAIVVATFFFILGVLAVGYYFYSKYTWYDVVIISCWFRTVSYCCRAAYLGGTYRPALEGTFLAFLNAGYGASQTIVCLTLGWWYMHKPIQVFKPRTESIIKWVSISMCFFIVCFGPILGVIAAGMIFGAYTHPVLGHRGIRIRFTASYGLISCNAVIALLALISTVGVFLASRTAGPKAGANPSRQNPKLVALLLLCSLLLLIRGCVGVTALYETKVFVWENDHFFYPLNTLPEMIAFCIFCWPCLLARIACCWPREDKRSKDEETPKQNLQHDDEQKVPEQPSREAAAPRGPQGVKVNFG